jgi:hypothetical protein
VHEGFALINPKGSRGDLKETLSCVFLLHEFLHELSSVTCCFYTFAYSPIHTCQYDLAKCLGAYLSISNQVRPNPSYELSLISTSDVSFFTRPHATLPQ